MTSLREYVRRVGGVRPTLGRAAYPPGTRNAWIGDSRFDNTWSTGPLLENYTPLDRLSTAMYGRLQSWPGDEFGTGGDTSTLIRARTDWYATTCPTGVFLFTTNDRTASAPTISLQDSKDNYTWILDKWCNEFRKTAIVISETPRFGAKVLTGSALDDHIAMHNWLRDLTGPRIKVVNVWDLLDATCFHDGLHMNAKGAHIVGQALYEQAYNAMYAPATLFPLAGGLAPNRAMPGTGGTATNLTGGSQVPNGHILSRSNTNVGTLTVLGSVYVDAAGKRWGQADVAGRPTDINLVEFRADLTLASLGLSVGQTVQAWGEFQIGDGAIGLGGAPLRLRPLDSGNATLATVEHGDFYSGALSLLPSTGFEGARWTPPLKLPVGTVTARISFIGQFPGVAAGADYDVAARLRYTNLDIIPV